MKTEETTPHLFIGADLHKLQFTVAGFGEDEGTVEIEGVFKTDDEGYQDFCNKVHELENKKSYFIEIAVEATGNARYFKNRMEAEQFKIEHIFQQWEDVVNKVVNH